MAISRGACQAERNNDFQLDKGGGEVSPRKKISEDIKGEIRLVDGGGELSSLALNRLIPKLGQ